MSTKTTSKMHMEMLRFTKILQTFDTKAFIIYLGTVCCIVSPVRPIHPTWSYILTFISSMILACNLR